MLDKIYNGRFALCNTGVSLVEKKCFKEALHIFHIALKVQIDPKNLESHKCRIKRWDSDVLPSNREEHADIALSSVANSSSHYETSFFVHRVDPIEVGIHPCKITQKANVIMVKLDELGATPSSSEYQDLENEFVCAVILQNIASTYLCHALDVNCTGHKVDIYLAAACRLYKGSHQILHKLMNSKNPDIMPEAASILLMVLHNMVQTVYHLGDFERFQNLSETLKEVHGFVSKLSSLGLYNQKIAHASAA
jgi:hypothetical protein